MKKHSLSMIAVFFTSIIILIACSSPTTPINVDTDGVAIKGYDPVAYFTDGGPLKGQKEFQLEWNNAKWLFASRHHLALFQEDPAKYSPQYGGY